MRAATAYPHRAGAAAQLMTVTATVPIGALDREAVAGDQTVFLSALAGLSSGDVIRLSGGGQPLEYHRATLLPSTDLVNFFDQPAIDVNGVFTLPPVCRVARLQILARFAAYHDVTVEIAPDYANGNDLTIVFTT